MANEKRLIDANVPLKQLSDHMEKLHCPDDYRYGLYRGMEIAESYIKNAPTVDAVEVVHGRWKKSNRFAFVECSVCQDIRILDGWIDTGKWNYCPNCGAMMRRRKKN